MFTVNGTGTTNVDLNVVDLTLGKLNPATGTVDADSEYEAVVNGDMANDLFDHINSDAKVEAYGEPTTTEPTPARFETDRHIPHDILREA